MTEKIYIKDVESLATIKEWLKSSTGKVIDDQNISFIIDNLSEQIKKSGGEAASDFILKLEKIKEMINVRKENKT